MTLVIAPGIQQGGGLVWRATSANSGQCDQRCQSTAGAAPADGVASAPTLGCRGVQPYARVAQGRGPPSSPSLSLLPLSLPPNPYPSLLTLSLPPNPIHHPKAAPDPGPNPGPEQVEALPLGEGAAIVLEDDVKLRPGAVASKQVEYLVRPK